jgi:GTP-binding protein
VKSVVAIVGRPNVGKSTLFNRLSRRRIALVEDIPGVTRDRNYNDVVWDDRTFTLIDTGGFDPTNKEDLLVRMKEQTLFAIEEADIILLLFDGREGVTTVDRDTVDLLRHIGKPIFHVVTKIDDPRQEPNLSDFFELGIERLYPISALHRIGIGDLMDDVVPNLADEKEGPSKHGIRVAMIGRPNVGKSSMINKLCGDQRSIVHHKPGTTRDSIDTQIVVAGRSYTMIDTAGIRRKGRTRIPLEKYCVIKALKSLERCDVAVIIFDAQEGPTDQDAHIAGYAYEKGKGCVILVNKWDLIRKDNESTKVFTDNIRRKIKFLEFAPILFVSAHTGQRVLKTLDLVDRVNEACEKRIETSILNRHLSQWIRNFHPPLYRKRPVKLNYITQSSVKPPTFVLFTNYPKGIHFSYRRYLTNQIRKDFGFEGTPIRLIFSPKKRTTS